MKLSPSQLEENGFVVADKLDHNELVPFIRKYLKSKNLFSLSYYGFNLLFLVIFATKLVFLFSDSLHSKSEIVLKACLGITYTFVLLPIHELIHAAAYKWVGATKTSFDSNWNKFYFMAVADKFVANRREFILVALAPFTVISVFLALGLLLTTSLTSLTFASALLFHASCCSGDFGLLSYFEHHKDKEVVTYDDAEKKDTWFLFKDRY